jgi:hypothetical protein
MGEKEESIVRLAEQGEEAAAELFSYYGVETSEGGRPARKIEPVSVSPGKRSTRMSRFKEVSKTRFSNIYMIAGILKHIQAMTVFFNPSEASYKRLGSNKAPGYVSWSAQNRSQLVRIPAAMGEYRRAELRSPDPGANPYLAFALMIYAGYYG